jgi:CO/xanthine dehydrogenase Mo-binding subunit
VAAEVAVDRSSGKVTVRRICGAFDIGTVINRRTAEVCIRGAIVWGIGYALSERIQLNGHRALTASFADYHIPRFSHIPNIEMEFFNNFHPEPLPRGCGEMPVIPTIGAIANAVYNAIGVRFHRTPITPSRIFRALNST